MKYRKKPVIIDAWKFDELKDSSLIKNMPVGVNGAEAPISLEGKIIPPKHGWVDTLEGTMLVLPGDYIIKGIKGEYYSCRGDIFEQTYEVV